MSYFPDLKLSSSPSSSKSFKMPKAMNALITRLKYVALALFTVYLVKLTVDVRPSLSPLYRMRVQLMDADAQAIWTDYITTHPVEADERYSFREMGFRAHLYAELARTGKYFMLDQLDSELWKFIPGASKIRSDAFGPLQTITSRSTFNLLGKRAELTKRRYQHTAAQEPRRGIVMVVKGGDVLPALQTIGILRKVHNCQLPVEIYFHTPDELPLTLQVVLEHQPNVKVFDIEKLSFFSGELEDDAGRYPGWKFTGERESLAMLATNFQEFILMDPDVVFLQDPSTLFEHPSFEQTGTLFFRSKPRPADKTSQYLVSFLKRQFDQGNPSLQLSQSPFWNHQIGSRQDLAVVALDKGRPGVLSALFMNAWIRRRTAREAVWGGNIEAMSEGLWLSFELSNITYAFENTWPGAIGQHKGDWEDEYSPAMCEARTLHFLSPWASLSHQSQYESNSMSSLAKSFRHLSPFGNPEEYISSKNLGQPIWFQGSMLKNHDKEIYFTPNVWSRQSPNNVDLSTSPAGAEDDSCLYGFPLKRLRKNSPIKQALSEAIYATHDTIDANVDLIRPYASWPRNAGELTEKSMTRLRD